jgi:hypothetical protein
LTLIQHRGAALRRFQADAAELAAAVVGEQDHRRLFQVEPRRRGGPAHAAALLRHRLDHADAVHAGFVEAVALGQQAG